MNLFIDVSIDISEIFLTDLRISAEENLSDRPRIDIRDSSFCKSITLLECQYSECDELIRECICDRIIERKEYTCATLECDMNFPLIREKTKESKSEMRKFSFECSFYEEDPIEHFFRDHFFILEKEFLFQISRDDFHGRKTFITDAPARYKNSIFGKEKLFFQMCDCCYEYNWIS